MHQRGIGWTCPVGVLGKLLLLVRFLDVELAVLVSGVLVLWLVHSVN
jgi:hypothetical protein